MDLYILMAKKIVKCPIIKSMMQYIQYITAETKFVSYPRSFQLQHN